MLFLLIGSAGAGKSAALKELSARRRDLLLLDLDDLRPPAAADVAWWRGQIETYVRRAAGEERDTVLAGWTTLDEVLGAPSSAALDGVAACLLDCDDAVRVERIERRAASGTWRAHTAAEVAGFLRAAEEMRRNATGVHRLDTSGLSAREVADRLEAWMAEQRGMAATPPLQ
jgi:hypothetical protein